MTDCIFCNIIARQAPGKIVYQDDLVTAFWDIHPLAPLHLLICPNKHIASVNDVSAVDEALMGHLFSVARRLAEQEGVAASGYRLIVNSGANSGQAVFHIHMHLLGGQRMRHPMG